jgi:predicted phosphodiesterase
MVRRKSHFDATIDSMENASISMKDDLNNLLTELDLSLGKGNIIICSVSSLAYRDCVIQYLRNILNIKILSLNIKDELIDHIRVQKLRGDEVLVWLISEYPSNELFDDINNFWNLLYKLKVPSLFFFPQKIIKKILIVAPDFWNYRSGFHELKGKIGGNIFQDIVNKALTSNTIENENLTKSKQIYEKLLANSKNEKNSVFILKDLGVIYYLLGEHERALEIADKIEDLQPNEDNSEFAGKSVEASRENKRFINWIHISDWHQKGKDFNRKVVKNALIRDIKKRTKLCPELSSIDFVIFSGDITSNGSEKEFKAVFLQLFDPLLKASGNLKRDQLFVVPGNHDLDEKVLDELPIDLLKHFKSNEDIEKWLLNKRNLKEILKPFHEFARLISYYSKQEQPDYASICLKNKAGDKVALLGFNSALMCRRKDGKKKRDKGFLIVGEPQVYSLLEEHPAVSGEDGIKIAVMHHPLEWLADFDRIHVESRLVKKCHFILCGHTHKVEVKQVKSTSGDYILINTGAGFYKRETENSINAYNLVHLDLDKGYGIVFLRRWNNENGEWEEYSSKGEQGMYKIELPEKNFCA